MQEIVKFLLSHSSVKVHNDISLFDEGYWNYRLATALLPQLASLADFPSRDIRIRKRIRHFAFTGQRKTKVQKMNLTVSNK